MKKAKNRVGYFEWLLNDTETIVPMVMTIGTHTAVLLTGFLTLKFHISGSIGFSIFFGLCFLVALWRLYKYYRYGNVKGLQGMSINDLAYNGKLGKGRKTSKRGRD